MEKVIKLPLKITLWQAPKIVKYISPNLRQYFEFYNYQRPHQSLKYQTPFEAYQKGQKIEQNKGAKLAISDKQLTP